ncbi:MAG: exodeoxyribonuclease VII small subunit [Phycisphaerae bacterium]|nr:exodeoxyribonuclease VII small subunit [Phycisphaerae bacterium]
MAKDSTAKDMTFEQALETLETIVTQIEQGKVSLEESIEKYAEGTTLIAKCRSILDGAEKKIALLSAKDGGLQTGGDLPEQD